jgi:hypothetical protein
MLQLFFKNQQVSERMPTIFTAFVTRVAVHIANEDGTRWTGEGDSKGLWIDTNGYETVTHASFDNEAAAQTKVKEWEREYGYQDDEFAYVFGVFPVELSIVPVTASNKKRRLDESD